MSLEETYIAGGSGTAASLIDSASYAASVTEGTGPVVQIEGARGEAVIILNAGTKTVGTNPTLDVALYESDSGSGSWTLVPNGAFTRATTTKSLQQLSIRPSERKNYVTAKITIGGTSTPTYPISAEILYLGPNP
jgi:hypothetical protein